MDRLADDVTGSRELPRQTPPDHGETVYRSRMSVASSSPRSWDPDNESGMAIGRRDPGSPQVRMLVPSSSPVERGISRMLMPSSSPDAWRRPQNNSPPAQKVDSAGTTLRLGGRGSGGFTGLPAAEVWYCGKMKGQCR